MKDSTPETVFLTLRLLVVSKIPSLVKVKGNQQETAIESRDF